MTRYIDLSRGLVPLIWNVSRRSDVSGGTHALRVRRAERTARNHRRLRH